MVESGAERGHLRGGVNVNTEHIIAFYVIVVNI
jgi:hypothetical protein